MPDDRSDDRHASEGRETTQGRVVTEHAVPGRRTFYAREGLIFTCDQDGSVRVSIDGRFVRLDASTWCSVVASMSMRGDTAEVFFQVDKLHRGVECERKSGS